MANEAQAGIDWTNDEAVVRAALPNELRLMPDASGAPSADDCVEMRIKAPAPFSDVWVQVGAYSSTIKGAWANARKHKDVVAFEREHRPSVGEKATIKATIQDPRTDLCVCRHSRDEHEHEDSTSKQCRACCAFSHCPDFTFLCSESSELWKDIKNAAPESVEPAKGFEEWHEANKNVMAGLYTRYAYAKAAWNAALQSAPSAEGEVTGAQLIAAERERQVSVESWTPEHDSSHGNGELALAAACYAAPEFAGAGAAGTPSRWPWQSTWWKPSRWDYQWLGVRTPPGVKTDGRVRDLVKAGALIAAEIDRLQCAEKASKQ